MNHTQKLLVAVCVASVAAFWLGRRTPRVGSEGIVNASAAGPVQADGRERSGARAALPERSGRRALPEVEQQASESLAQVPAPQHPVPSASFEDGVLLVAGVPFDQVPVETWEFDDLLELNRSIRSIQVELKHEFLANNPTEHLFVSNEDYMTYRMWHGGMILHGHSRVVVNDEGEEVIEYGYMKVPIELAPEEYLLRDAVERLYRSPSYVNYLIGEGEDYQAVVLAKHPDATLDVTDDLTRWIFLDPDGKVVGWQAYSRFGDR